MREQAEWRQAIANAISQTLSEPARRAATEMREVLLPSAVFRLSGMVRTDDAASGVDPSAAGAGFVQNG